MNYKQIFVLLVAVISTRCDKTTILAGSRFEKEDHVLATSGLGSHGIGSNIHKFFLYHLSRNGTWQEVERVANSNQGIALMIHGWEFGSRSKPFQPPNPADISRKFGFIDNSKPNRPTVPIPIQNIKPDIYALLWDSRFRDPVQLENHLLVNRRVGVEYIPQSDLQFFDEVVEPSLPTLEESDAKFLTDIFNYYKTIFRDYKGTRPHLAGFSKGAHLSIKIAGKTLEDGLDIPSAAIPQMLTLMDTFVGPAWVNDAAGKKLLENITKITDKQISILNISTSNIDTVQLGPLRLSDQEFRQELRKIAGELKIERNEDEIAIKHYTNGPTLGIQQMIFDHSHAPQFFIGSSLLCDQKLPGINSSSDQIHRFFANKSQLVIKTPPAISRWLYHQKPITPVD